MKNTDKISIAQSSQNAKTRKQAEDALRKIEELYATLINTIPDIVIEPKIVIYADGCWWHCCSTCNLKYTNFEARGRDQYVNTGLLRAGYKVFRFWEHEIKKDVKACVDQIEAYLNEQKVVKNGSL